jgi:hypothetical protein
VKNKKINKRRSTESWTPGLVVALLAGSGIPRSELQAPSMTVTNIPGPAGYPQMAMSWRERALIPKCVLQHGFLYLVGPAECWTRVSPFLKDRLAYDVVTVCILYVLAGRHRIHSADMNFFRNGCNCQQHCSKFSSDLFNCCDHWGYGTPSGCASQQGPIGLFGFHALQRILDTRLDKQVAKV